LLRTSEGVRHPATESGAGCSAALSVQRAGQAAEEAAQHGAETAAAHYPQGDPQTLVHFSSCASPLIVPDTLLGINARVATDCREMRKIFSCVHARFSRPGYAGVDSDAPAR